MVGRQTSHGCATCRRRKCDLASPSCYACIKFGAPCPGYFDRFVAVGSQQQLTIRKAKIQASHAFAVKNLSAANISSATDLLRAEFVAKLELDRLAAQLCMISATNVLSHVASRIGESRVLDHAVRCIIYDANSSSYEGPMESRRLYGIALNSLRHAIVDPLLSRRPETLAAATLLQMYEQYLKPGSQMATHHAYGAWKMLQTRGIDNLNDDLETAILEAQAGCLFLGALMTQEESFLSHPAWLIARNPSTSAGRFLDSFVQSILDHAAIPETEMLIDNICGFRGDVDPASKERLSAVVLSDALRIRHHIKNGLDARLAAEIPISRDHLGLDSMQIAMEFFLFFVDSALLCLLKSVKQKPDFGLAPYSEDLTESLLHDERESVLLGLKLSFPHLRESCPRMYDLAPAVFRVISGTMMGLSQAGDGEKEILLAMLDQAERSQWPWSTHCVH